MPPHAKRTTPRAARPRSARDECYGPAPFSAGWRSGGADRPARVGVSAGTGPRLPIAHLRGGCHVVRVRPGRRRRDLRLPVVATTAATTLAAAASIETVPSCESALPGCQRTARGGWCWICAAWPIASASRSPPSSPSRGSSSHPAACLMCARPSRPWSASAKSPTGPGAGQRRPVSRLCRPGR